MREKIQPLDYEHILFNAIAEIANNAIATIISVIAIPDCLLGLECFIHEFRTDK